MVNLRPILFVLGLVLSKIALFMYVPTLVAFFTGTEGFMDFAAAVLITHSVAFLLLSFGKTDEFKLSVRDMFLIDHHAGVDGCQCVCCAAVCVY